MRASRDPPARGIRVADLGHRLEPERLGEGDGLGDVVHEPGGNARPGERVDPVRSGCRRERGLDGVVELVAVRDPVGVGREARVVGEPGLAQHRRQGPELLVVADRDHELAIGGVEHRVRRDRRMPVAEPAGRHAGGERRRRLVRERGEEALQQVHLDELARAGAVAVAQREQDPGDGVLPGEHVDEGDADLAGLAVGLARDAHEPADGLHEQVVARQRRTLARRRIP